MRIIIRSLKMTQIDIDFGGTPTAALQARHAMPGRLLSGSLTIGAASFVAILFLIGFLLVDIGTIVMIISKFLAAGLALLLLTATILWTIKGFGRLIDQLVEWWLRLWVSSSDHFTTAQTQRHQHYQKHRFLV